MPTNATLNTSTALVLLGALATSLASPPAAAQPVSGSELQELNRRIDEQVIRLSNMRRELDAEQVRLRQLQRAVSEQTLAGQRGGANTSGHPPEVAAEALSASSTSAQSESDPVPQPVGQARSGASEQDTARQNIAAIFEQPGVLTGKGRFVLEPSTQYSYSSNNRVAVLGYSVIPALVIGLVDVREVKRNTVMAALTVRYGVTNRLEVEARMPYVYRSDSTISREVGAGSAADRVFGGSGSNIGDIELAARYQFNDGGVDRPYFIGSLRYKSRTGRSPFDVVTDCMTRCVGNTTGTGLPLELPTGSGFHSIQPSLTWLIPSEPAVLFGTFSYQHSFKRQVSRLVLNGEREDLGTIAPGGVFGFNIGIGLSLNDRSSISFGYDHSSVAATRQNGEKVPGSVRVQLGTLVVGYSHRISPDRSINVAIGAGLTRDTPDLSLTVKMPFTF